MGFIRKFAECFEEKSEEFISRFGECFNDIGCLNYVHHTDLDPNVKPSISYQRKIPFALQPKLKDELDRVKDLGVI